MSRKSHALKRQVAQADFHIDQSLFRIMALHKDFEPVHPEEAEILETAAQGLIVCQDLLQWFWRRCWGGDPEGMSRYLGKRIRKE